ncbi:predicted protein [Chaetomium globosum CBS 148.51]|uniref:Uncharacterized protein n=1 Tax=Chaetomium globosum (strain ATCC 6205 / CBS 148.51 / DSM 1962 / NBRC 6347 / NRRL 1970) TaxID=306901 RepID=Q2H455_CHAGB|nr:uncharacterized protein CHGG_06560 [Chaetomium globosum CBS 148.51]EAQ89941.1 predicted protein [Chaetomium globosum CBS 148.51]
MCAGLRGDAAAAAAAAAAGSWGSFWRVNVSQHWVVCKGGEMEGVSGAVIPLRLLLSTATVLDVLFSDAPACEEGTVTVRSVVSLQVDEKNVAADELLLAGVVSVAGTGMVSSHEVDDSLIGADTVSSQLVDVAAGADTVSLQDVDSVIWLDCVVSSVQVVSRGALAVLVWDWDAGDEMVSPEVQLVEAVLLAEAVPLAPLLGEDTDGPVDCEETIELVRLPETGGPLELLAIVVDAEDPGVLPMDPGVVTTEVVPEVERDTSTGLVPVGPTLTTVELGSGKGAGLDKADDGPGDPVPVLNGEVKPPVPLPPLPVGKVPDPAMDEILVAFGNGNGAEPEPVARLVGAVAPPLVREAQVLEFDKGKGAEAEEAPGGQIPVPEDGSDPLEDPGPPVTELALPVGPAVGPPAREELLIGNGGVCIDVREPPGGPWPDGAVPVGQGSLVELDSGNGAEIDPLLSGNGTLAMLLPGGPPMPVDLEKPPDGPVPQEDDVSAPPTPDVELETGNGTVEVVLRDDETPVGDVTPVPGAVPEGHDKPPVELPTEKGGAVTDAVPDAEPPLVPVPVIDAVALVNGKEAEEAAEVPVREPVPGGALVPDSNSAPEVDPIVPGTVPEPDPVAVVLLAGSGVERDVPALVPGPAPPCAEVVEGLPVTESGIVFTGIVGVTNKVVVRWTVLTGCLVVEFGGMKKLELVASVADVVPAIGDEEPDVAAEVDPTPDSPPQVEVDDSKAEDKDEVDEDDEDEEEEDEEDEEDVCCMRLLSPDFGEEALPMVCRKLDQRPP